MPVSADFTIDTTLKRIYHSLNNTHYKVNELYSWLQDEFDALGYMDDAVPMSAQTPTEYTMINGWFIDENSIKFLYGGAIKSDGWLHPTNITGIRMIRFKGTYTNCIAGDIGKIVLGAGTGDTGKLLYFNNTTKKWWVRCDAADDLFDAAETVGTVGDGGTGTGTSMAASTSGEELYANLYTLGTIESTPYSLLYVEQRDPVAPLIAGNRTTVTNSRRVTVLGTAYDWWDRDNTYYAVSYGGQIDICLKVKEMGQEIDGANVIIFGRQYSDLFDDFPIDVSAGGRNAVPLATARDLNNAKPEYYLFVDNQQAAIAVGDMVHGDTSAATAEVVSVTDWGAALVLGLGTVRGVWADNENMDKTSDDSWLAVVNGTVGTMFVAYDNEAGGPFAVANTITGADSNATGTLKGLQDDGASGKLCILMAGAGQYFDYEDNEQLDNGAGCTGDAVGDGVRSIAGMDDILIGFVNGTLVYDNVAGGPFTVGEIITGATSGATAMVLDDDETDTLTLANVSGVFQNNEEVEGADSGATADVDDANGLTVAHTMNKNFEQGNPYPYDVIVDCAGRYIADVYEYMSKFCTREAQTSKTFYTFVHEIRVLHFTANNWVNFVESDIGRVITGDVTADTGRIINYDNGNKLVYVRVDDPTGDWFDEAEAVTVTAGTGDGETAGCSALYPMNGEHYIEAYMAYAPKKSAPFGEFAGGVLFGARGIWVEFMNADDSKNYSLIDSNGDTRNPPNKQNITVTGLHVGDAVMVFRTTAGAINKAMYISHNLNNDAGNDWFEVTTDIATDTPAGTGDTGVIRIVANSIDGLEDRHTYDSWDAASKKFLGLIPVLAHNYDNTDTCYIPFIDKVATAVTEYVQVIYTAERTVICRVRRYDGTTPPGDSIIPFQTSELTFGSSGLPIAAIRTADSIVTTL